jgi:predicted metal-dependent hydrolase
MDSLTEIRQVRDIEYQLLPGKNRKTTDIVIERDGIITVRPPLNLTPEQIDAVVESKRLWIYRHLAEWQELNASYVVREWVNGETFWYLGRSYRLALVSEQSCSLRLKAGRFYLHRQILEQEGKAGAQKAFKAYFTAKGQQKFSDRVHYYAPKVGVQITGIKIKDLGYRWASCSNSGILSFHWVCMMAPLKIIDYITVHELCHLHHRNHSNAFWNEVDKVMPDYAERKEWLRKHGASLTL